MSKVKLDVPDEQAQGESLVQGQDGEPKDVQDLTGFVSHLARIPFRSKTVCLNYYKGVMTGSFFSRF
jgi:hypothetical protein